MQTIERFSEETKQALLTFLEHSYGGLVFQGDCRKLVPKLKDFLNESVTCAYLDPPYRNGDRYSTYNDDLSHEDWSRLISSSVPLLFDLLKQDGSIWISIDDSEMANLKVMCDSWFGADRFVSTIVWEHRLTRENRSTFSHNHEYILVYAKDPAAFKKKRHKIRMDKLKKRYKNPDHDPRGPWQSVTATAQAGHSVPSQFYEITAPVSGKKHFPPKGRCWVYNKERMEKEIAEGNIWFGADYLNSPRIKRFLSNANLDVVPSTLWKAEEVGTTRDAKKEILAIANEDEIFDTPKPEALIRRILEISTDEEDIVCDIFSGSGTTASVAYKSGRRFLAIEQNKQNVQLIKKRLELAVPDSLDFFCQAFVSDAGQLIL